MHLGGSAWMGFGIVGDDFLDTLLAIVISLVIDLLKTMTKFYGLSAAMDTISYTDGFPFRFHCVAFWFLSYKNTIFVYIP